MNYNYIRQQLYTFPSQPTLDWRKNYFLYPPQLYEPADEEDICVENHPWTKGTSSGILLDWTVVVRAAKYIVQWCKNSSFQGPTLRAAVTSASQYTLVLGDDIKFGDEIH